MATDSQKSDRYNAREAEPRWQKGWDDHGTFATPTDPFGPRAPAGKPAGPKYCVLEMFPYPSGRIHTPDQTQSVLGFVRT